MSQLPPNAMYTMETALTQTIKQLAHEASVEINVPDIKHLEASKTLLSPGRLFARSARGQPPS